MSLNASYFRDWNMKVMSKCFIYHTADTAGSMCPNQYPIPRNQAEGYWPKCNYTLITRFMGPTWGPTGTCKIEQSLVECPDRYGKQYTRVCKSITNLRKSTSGYRLMNERCDIMSVINRNVNNIKDGVSSDIWMTGNMNYRQSHTYSTHAITHNTHFVFFKYISDAILA